MKTITLNIFLLIGQSNMAGRGRVCEVPELRHPQVFMFREGRWDFAAEPLHTDRHFTSAPLREFGLRYARRFLEVVGQDTLSA